MNLNYNLSRHQAAKILWVSTRTLDRYIRKGLLSYRKVWNRVYLSEEEVLKLKESKEFQKEINQVYDSQVLSWESSNLAVKNNLYQIEAILQENFDKFLKLLEEKDRIIEEKNRIIFSLQHKLWEIESKFQNMIALPDYTREKEKLLLEKEKLEIENQQLFEKIKKEKVWNLTLLLCLVLVLVILAFMVK